MELGRGSRVERVEAWRRDFGAGSRRRGSSRRRWALLLRCGGRAAVGTWLLSARGMRIAGRLDWVVEGDRPDRLLLRRGRSRRRRSRASRSGRIRAVPFRPLLPSSLSALLGTSPILRAAWRGRGRGSGPRRWLRAPRLVLFGLGCRRRWRRGGGWCTGLRGAGRTGGDCVAGGGSRIDSSAILSARGSS